MVQKWALHRRSLSLSYNRASQEEYKKQGTMKTKFMQRNSWGSLRVFPANWLTNLRLSTMKDVLGRTDNFYPEFWVLLIA